jgi:hypothetical protein
MKKKQHKKTLTLFFFKLYTSAHIIDISLLVQFLEISIKEFTSVGAKLILNTNDDNKVEQEFNQLNILNFNPSKKTEFEFVQEVTLSFDSILRFTSLEIWNAKNLADRKATASENLDASLKADDIANTTELVAKTIMKASVDPQGNACSVKNLEKNTSYAVNCQDSNFVCKAFVKYRYCKHLLFVLKSTNRSSATIDLSSVRTFVYRGNTRRAREHANNGTAWANRPHRGRVPNASSAVNRM